MLRHRIVGTNRKLTKKDVDGAVELFCDEMFPKSLHNDTFLVIRFLTNKEMVDTGYDNHFGVMYARDNKSIKHKKFTVVINSSQTKKCQLITLFHELMHVKQARLGHLRFVEQSMYKWRSELVSEFRGNPWEKDPVKYEEKLYRKYLKTLTSNGKKTKIKHKTARSKHVGSRILESHAC